MSKKLMRSLILGIACVFALCLVPAGALAHEGEEHEDDSTTTSQKRDGQEDDTASGSKRSSLKERLQSLKEKRQENQEKRLGTAKQKICENRKTNITAILNRSVTRAERQLELFTKISERVKTFYTEKGHTLANYDELVAAVDAAKAKAAANLETLKSLTAFSCDSEDPKGDLEAFKLALKSVNQDLKDLRTAVKNLIVAVKSAQSNGSGDQQGGDQ